MTSIYKEGWKKDLQVCQPDLSAREGQGADQNVQDNQGMKPSQHGIVKGRSCLTNLITFYEKVIHTVDEGKAVN